MFVFVSLESKIPIKGFLFHKGRLKILVYKMYSMQTSDLLPVTKSSFVEISCVVSSAGQVRIHLFLISISLF